MKAQMLRIAELLNSDLEDIKKLESKLGIVLVAYDNNRIQKEALSNGKTK